MKAVCEALGVARSNISARMQSIRRHAGLKSPIAKPLKRVGRPPAPEEGLVARIKAILAEQPTYGYRRVWAMVRREGREKGLAPVNAKRVHRVMKAHGMLLQRHAGGAEARRHDGKIAVAHSNLRWCSHGFELACDNGEKVRVAFALDCATARRWPGSRPRKASKGKMSATLWSRPSNLASVRSIACRGPSNGSATTDQATSPRRPEPWPAISASSR
jgi:transposase InsO family protein